MMNFISKLRQKPEGVRRRIAFLLTVCITLVIVAIWGTSFYLSVSHSDDAIVVEHSPFDSLKSNLANIASAFDDEKEAIKKSFNFGQ